MEVVPRFGAGKRSISTMSGKKTQRRAQGSGSSGAAKKMPAKGRPTSEPPRISGRWLFWAVSGTVATAALCAWGVLCLLFWQGSWQLLYSPSAQIMRTPASAGLAFEPVAFAVTEEGTPRIRGWWIPAEPNAQFGRYSVLFLHGKAGNMGDTLDALSRLHQVGVNILAFDYRGYGQSQFVRPSEASLRQDADWALSYLSATRHIDSGTIVLDGEGLGANLALEVGAAHPELAGVIVESPISSPMNAIFNDARAKLVPARLLVRDRYDMLTASARMRIPVLWFERVAQDGSNRLNGEPAAYREVANHKTLVWLNPQINEARDFSDAAARWLDGLPSR